MGRRVARPAFLRMQPREATAAQLVGEVFAGRRDLDESARTGSQPGSADSQLQVVKKFRANPAFSARFGGSIIYARAISSCRIARICGRLGQNRSVFFFFA